MTLVLLLLFLAFVLVLVLVARARAMRGVNGEAKVSIANVGGGLMCGTGGFDGDDVDHGGGAGGQHRADCENPEQAAERGQRDLLYMRFRP
ncbi:MAG: hypothetical protein IRZ07_27825 [Microbispora sp.]|nr:hypothetical protein [Microbispora sp.]